MHNLISRLLTPVAFAFAFGALSVAHAAAPDWSADARAPAGGRANIYQKDAAAFAELNRQGRIHAQVYPVPVTGTLPPLEPLRDSLTPTRAIRSRDLSTRSFAALRA